MVIFIAYEGFALVDSEGRIVKWNYEELLGIKEEDAIKKRNLKLKMVKSIPYLEIAKVLKHKYNTYLKINIYFKPS